MRVGSAAASRRSKLLPAGLLGSSPRMPPRLFGQPRGGPRARRSWPASQQKSTPRAQRWRRCAGRPLAADNPRRGHTTCTRCGCLFSVRSLCSPNEGFGMPNHFCRVRFQRFISQTWLSSPEIALCKNGSASQNLRLGWLQLSGSTGGPPATG